MTNCPNCGSPRTRRGGGVIWAVYLVLIAVMIPVVLLWSFNAAIFGAIMIAIVLLAHLVFNQRVCLDCGEQFKKRPDP